MNRTIEEYPTETAMPLLVANAYRLYLDSALVLVTWEGHGGRVEVRKEHAARYGDEAGWRPAELSGSSWRTEGGGPERARFLEMLAEASAVATCLDDLFPARATDRILCGPDEAAHTKAERALSEHLGAAIAAVVAARTV
jgi:hypothetical protein